MRAKSQATGSGVLVNGRVYPSRLRGTWGNNSINLKVEHLKPFLLAPTLKVRELPRGGRRSGRTYRMLQLALQECRQGKKVAVVGSTRQCVEMLKREMSSKLNATAMELINIQFLPKHLVQNRLRGTQLDRLFVDHFALGPEDHQDSRAFASLFEYEIVTRTT